MWSPYHYLFIIRKDKLYSTANNTSELKTILNSFEEITSTGNLTYRNKKQYPSISILIVKSVQGNFSIKDEHTTFSQINHIEVETSKNDTQKESYLKFMINLASKLNWELILSEDEETLIWNEEKNCS